MGEADLNNYFLCPGLHSLGMIEIKIPIFDPNSLETLKENMVINIDILIFNAPWADCAWKMVTASLPIVTGN